ncbi:MAG: sulfatase, partial [Verrucomicrobiota bacterium]
MRFWTFLAIVTGTTLPPIFADDSRPNILWLFAEDTSPWMDCYGYEAQAGATPHIDSIAERGVRFARAYVPAPVCSACRSAMMAGANQIRFGAHEHRSSRAPDAQLSLPEGMKLLPQIMKEAGYYTFNHGKTDYNFVWDNKATYSDEKATKDRWAQLKENQPFFGQIQTKGGKINTKGLPNEQRTNPSTVTVPADYPDNDMYREVVAQHCDAIRTDDAVIGTILQDLEASGMMENTIVIYFSDHGANHLVRHKQMPTEGGLHVPFVVMGPEVYVPEKGVRNDLVNMLDLSATTLAWAGVSQPDWYEGQDLFAEGFEPRSWVASAKDRLDHTIDRVRTIRTDQFRYTRNFKLDRILLQPQYRDGQRYLENLKTLYAAGELSEDHKRIFFGERPTEELYQVSTDPAQVHNLAKDPAYAEELARHRSLLDDWLAKGDTGEGEEVAAALIHNGDDWKGGRGVNPEYEANRTDGDGDGLSDKWESINGRDPEDGRLFFDFDCGGWQTEGWEGKGMEDNLAGFLGFLDFRLSDKDNAMVRSDLGVEAVEADQALAVRLKSSEDIDLVIEANGKPLAQGHSVGAGEFVEVTADLQGNDHWTGTINTLVVTFSGPAEDMTPG